MPRSWYIRGYVLLAVAVVITLVSGWRGNLFGTALGAAMLGVFLSSLFVEGWWK